MFFLYVVLAVEAVLGVGSTAIIAVMLFGTIGYKIYRKIRYGISVFN